MTVAPLGPVASTVMSAGSASWGEVVSRLIVTDPDEVPPALVAVQVKVTPAVSLVTDAL